MRCQVLAGHKQGPVSGTQQTQEQDALPQVGWQAVETAFWQIVEEGEDPVEVIYGADLDTTLLGSGFPCASGRMAADPYASAPWNLNNIPRLAGAVTVVACHARFSLTMSAPP